MALYSSKGLGSMPVLVFPAIDPMPMKAILSISGAGSAEVDKQQCFLFSRGTSCSCAISQFNFTACFRRLSVVPIEQQVLPFGS